MSTSDETATITNSPDRPEKLDRFQKRNDFRIQRIGHNNLEINRAIKQAAQDTELYRKMLAERLEVCKDAVTKVTANTERPKYKKPVKRKLLEVQQELQRLLDEMEINDLDGACTILVIGLLDDRYHKKPAE